MLRYATGEDGTKGDSTQESENPELYDQVVGKVSCVDKVLLNRPAKVIFLLLLLALVAPPICYYYFFSSSLDFLPSDGYSIGSCLLSVERRIPCGYQNVTESECDQQCCFDAVTSTCFHRLPSRFSYIMDRVWNELSYFQPRIKYEPYSHQTSMSNLGLSFDDISTTHMSFMIYDPIKIIPSAQRLEVKQYSYNVYTPELELVISAGGKEVLRTDRGPLIVADNIWEWSFYLTDELMFGLGEIPLNGYHKKIIYSNKQSNFLPLIFARKGEQFHALYIDAIMPTEIEILESNNIVIRTITSDKVTFHVFTGPTPADIYRDVSLWSNNRRTTEFWEMGVHVCSSTPTSISELEAFIHASQSEGFPFDSHCGTSALLLDPLGSFEELINSADILASNGKKLLVHVPPYIINNNHTAARMQKNIEGIFLENTDGSNYIGMAKGNEVLYPDYSHDNSTLLLESLWPDGLKVDGVALIDNWPLDESVADLSNMGLPYFSQELEKAFNNTLLWNTIHPQSIPIYYAQHIYNHNLYGHYHINAMISFQNIPSYSSSRTIISKAGFHHESMETSWTNLRKELIHISLAASSGLNQWKTPICGDTNFDIATHNELCTKWYMLAVFLPFVYVESSIYVTEFSGVNKVYIQNALKRRYSLLSYYHTVLHNGPIVRPMFVQFPDETDLHSSFQQFAIGDALLIAPNFLPEQSLHHITLPHGLWYELWSGVEMKNGEDGILTVPTTLADFVVFIRGGFILPVQEETKLTAEATRLESPYTLIIALNKNTEEGSYQAEGSLKISEDLIINFQSTDKFLQISRSGESFSKICIDTLKVSSNRIIKLKIYGLERIYNNYDNYRQIGVDFNLCDLEESDVQLDFIDI